MDTQTLLINLQKHIVHSKKDAQENPWHINDLLPAVVAYIFPFYQELLQSRDKGKFQELVLVLKPFISRNREHLAKYTFDALCNAVKDKWIPRLENPFALLKPISPLFESIDEKGYVIFKSNTFNGLMERNFDDLPRLYGTSDYMPQEVTCATAAQVQRERVPRNNNQIDREVMINAQTELIELFKKLGETRRNNLNCYRYDIFSERELTDWNSPLYAWQWNFTVEEYGQIKRLLANHSIVLQQIINKRPNLLETKEIIASKLLQLYVAEWYKRDFNGNNRQGNAFLSIGLNGNSAENLCRNLGITEDTVYKSNIDEDGNETGQNEWLYTLYVGGGLPIKYLLSEGKGEEFTRSIRKIIEEEDCGNNDIACDLGDLCGNGVVNQSYRGRISIFDFIQETIIDETLVVEGFEDFKEKIHAMKKESLKCKFKLNYKLFKAGYFFQLTPQLCLNPEPNGVKYAISSKRLEQWNITPIGNSFEIRIQCGDQLIWKERFSKCLGGYYVARNRQESYELRINSAQLTKPWIVSVDNNEVKTALDNPLQKKGFVQFYSRGNNDWNSISGNNYDRTAILFDWTKGCSLDEDENSRIKENNDFGWKEYEDKIEFSIDGKKQVCYSKAGVLDVELKNEHYHHLSQYFEEKDINGRHKDINGRHLELIRLGDKPSFSVVITKKINGDITSSEIPEKDYKIECQRGKTGSFISLLENTINESGYWEIKISYLRKSKIVRCFALPSDAQIDNNIRHQWTDFINFGDLIIQYNNEQLNRDNNNVVRKRWCDNEINYNSPIAFYTITDGVAGFRLNTYQPIKATVAKKITNNDLFGVGRDKDRLKIPILLLYKLDLFRLPENEIITIDKYTILGYAFSQMKNYQYQAPFNHNIRNIIIKTFTHYQTTYQQHKIVLELGNIQYESLHFSFIPSNNPLCLQDIKLERADDVRYFFDLSKINQEGFIVQRIEIHDFPNVLVSPIHSQNLTPEQRSAEQKKFYDLYMKDDFSEAIAYFDIAIKTGMYFACFDPLLGLVWSDVDAAKLLARLYQTYCNQNKSVSYVALWRFADEFLFDWTLIPRDIWKELFSDNLDSVNQLFSRRAGRDMFLSEYWDFTIKQSLKIDDVTRKMIEWKKSKPKLKKFPDTSDLNILLSYLNDDAEKYRLRNDFNKQKLEIEKQNSCLRPYNIYLRTISNTYRQQRDIQNSEKLANFWTQDIRRRVSVLREIQNGSFFDNINRYINS